MLIMPDHLLMSANEIFASLRDDYFLPAFKKMALSHAITTTHFYNTIHDFENPLERIDITHGALSEEDDFDSYARSDAVYKSYRRLHQIIERLSMERASDNEKPGKVSFFCPKIYDSALQESMLSSYNNTAKLIGQKDVRSISIERLLSSYLLDDGDTKTLPENFYINEYALLNLGYVCSTPVSEHQGFSFIEAAALSCIYQTFYRSSVPTLNRPVENDNQRRRACARFKKLSNVLYSKDFYRSLCRTAIDVLAFNCEPDQNLQLQKFFNAPFITDTPQEKDIGQHLSPQISKPLPPVKPETKSKKARMAQYNAVTMATYICNEVFPVVELMLIGAIPMGQSNMLSDTAFWGHTSPQNGDEAFRTSIDFKNILLVSPYIGTPAKDMLLHLRSWEISEATYWISCELAHLLNTYINYVLESVISLLACLPESKIFEAPTIEEMFHKWNNKKAEVRVY